VPFRPTQGRPVFCKECFQQRKFAGAGGVWAVLPRNSSDRCDGSFQRGPDLGLVLLRVCARISAF